MNKKGWGLPEMILLSSIIIMALMIVVINVKKISNNINTPNNNTEKANSNSKNNDNEISRSENNNSTTNDNSNSNKQTNSNNLNITSIESKMINEAKKYIDNNQLYNNIGSIIVDKSHLIEQDEDLKNEMTNENCNGYVKVDNDGTNNYYTPYLKCDLYLTEGYNDLYNQ